MISQFGAITRWVQRKIWAGRTYLFKKKVIWQDRLGCYTYARWIRQVEQPAIQSFLKTNPGGIQVGQFCLVITGTAPPPSVVQEFWKSMQRWSGGEQVQLALFVPEQSRAEYAGLSLQCPCVNIVWIPSSRDPNAWLCDLEKIPGEWVIPVDCLDKFQPQWLVVVSKAMHTAENADVVYWDQDQYNSAGKRIRPFFKPGWSPALLYSINYLECAAFRKSILARVTARDGNKIDTWRLEAAVKARQILHIPFVLQHKPGIAESERKIQQEQHARAVQSWLELQGVVQPECRVENGNIRVRWKAEPVQVSIIIPTRDNLYYLQRCLSTLLEKTTYLDYQILLMDDHSTAEGVWDYYHSIQEKHPHIRVYSNPGKFNYSGVNNQGASLSQGSLLLFLNNDVEIIDGSWLDEMVRWVLQPGVGICGAKLNFPDGTIQHAGVVLGMTGHANHLYIGTSTDQPGMFCSPDWYRDVSAVTGACMLIRRDVFEQVGGFDENLPLVFNDIDLCLRVRRAGYRILYNPAARLIHYEGRSRAKYIPAGDIRLGASLLEDVIRNGDPFYNPNLSLTVTYPTLKRSDEPDPLNQLRQIVRYKG
ncbi:MAG TPA: glycosyltransferase family 2 protein [Anaerolineaceae bacterium]